MSHEQRSKPRLLEVPLSEKNFYTILRPSELPRRKPPGDQDIPKGHRQVKLTPTKPVKNKERELGGSPFAGKTAQQDVRRKDKLRNIKKIKAKPLRASGRSPYDVVRRKGVTSSKQEDHSKSKIKVLPMRDLPVADSPNPLRPDDAILGIILRPAML